VAETTAEDWIASFAEAIEAEPPDREQVGRLLKLAAVAAHSSERIAAPIACWVAGSSGKPLAELERVAEGLASG
jgi:hypothetical protein